MINEVYALNAVHTNTGRGGVLPDAYFELESASDMARSLAGNTGEKTMELPVSPDEKSDGIEFRISGGAYTYEVVRLRIAY